MKSTENIWQEFNSGSLSAEDALQEIGEKLRNCSAKETPKWLKLYERILDKEVPMDERNSDVEKSFWAATHKETED